MPLRFAGDDPDALLYVGLPLHEVAAVAADRARLVGAFIGTGGEHLSSSSGAVTLGHEVLVLARYDDAQNSRTLRSPAVGSGFERAHRRVSPAIKRDLDVMGRNLSVHTAGVLTVHRWPVALDVPVRATVEEPQQRARAP